VCAGRRKKKEQNLLYQRERSIRPGEEKQIQARKILNSKVLKLWLLLREAARPTPQQGTSARAQSSGNYTMPEFNIGQYVFFLSD
jgi:hypothetical protein